MKRRSVGALVAAGVPAPGVMAWLQPGVDLEIPIFLA